MCHHQSFCKNKPTNRVLPHNVPPPPYNVPPPAYYIRNTYPSGSSISDFPSVGYSPEGRLPSRVIPPATFSFS
jgi:hypothetical protein